MSQVMSTVTSMVARISATSMVTRNFSLYFLPDSLSDSQVTSTVTSMVANLQCNYLSQKRDLILQHIGPARVEGKMEQSVGCAEWLILPCCATHRAKWNGQPWQNYPAGNYKKEGKAECHTGYIHAWLLWWIIRKTRGASIFYLCKRPKPTQLFKQIMPGISSLVGNTEGIKDHVVRLVDEARTHVPEEKHSNTLLAFMATAGNPTGEKIVRLWYNLIFIRALPASSVKVDFSRSLCATGLFVQNRGRLAVVHPFWHPSWNLNTMDRFTVWGLKTVNRGFFNSDFHIVNFFLLILTSI